MTLLLALLLGLTSGFFGRGALDDATAAPLCTDAYEELKQEMLASGLQFYGVQAFQGGEVHAWVDPQTGEFHVYGFASTPEIALQAQANGFVGRGICLTLGGAEVYRVYKAVAPAPLPEADTSTPDSSSTSK